MERGQGRDGEDGCVGGGTWHPGSSQAGGKGAALGRGRSPHEAGPHLIHIQLGGARFSLSPSHHTAPLGGPHGPGDLGSKNSSHAGGRGRPGGPPLLTSPAQAPSSEPPGLWYTPQPPLSPYLQMPLQESSGDFSSGAWTLPTPPSTQQPPFSLPGPPSKLNPYLFCAPTLGPRSSSRGSPGGAACPWQSGQCSAGAWWQGACSGAERMRECPAPLGTGSKSTLPGQTPVT